MQKYEHEVIGSTRECFWAKRFNNYLTFCLVAVYTQRTIRPILTPSTVAAAGPSAPIPAILMQMRPFDSCHCWGSLTFGSAEWSQWPCGYNGQSPLHRKNYHNDIASEQLNTMRTVCCVHVRSTHCCWLEKMKQKFMPFFSTCTIC